MSVFGGNSLLLTSAGGAYQISRSLRFNSPDSAYLSKSFASAGSQTTWTFSAWIKLSGVDGGIYPIFSADSDQSQILLYLNTLYFGTSAITYRLTSQVFRDPSAWQHLLIALDTTNATAANRVRIYVNGAEVTAFSGTTTISQNSTFGFNGTGTHRIGNRSLGGFYNGYLAECFFIDGQALTPSSFTETNATTGQLVPKAFTGSYGTNGFKLSFADNSSNTATTLGKDSAGSNNWTPNNLSVTAGAGNDSLVDTPTSYGTGNSGGDVRGNFCTLNPLDKNANITPANGNLDLVGTGTTHRAIRATFAVSSGKWYWEATVNSYSSGLFGIARSDASLADGQFVGANATSWGYIGNGNKYNSGSAAGYGASFTTGDVIGVALDADNGTLVFYKNGSSQGTAYTGLTSGPYFPAVSTYSSSDSYSFNFGQRAFAYPLSGFKALVDTNLPAVDPAVAKPNTVMDVALYTGNGSTQTISGLGFSPDLVWIKARSSSQYWHELHDIIRGAGTGVFSNSAFAEITNNSLTSFDAAGFSVSTQSNTQLGTNENNGTYVAWAWDAGTSTVSNTAGSITSQVRANASAGFSVVTYTSQSSGSATIGHGLGVAPSLIINKPRDQNLGWTVYHASLGNAAYLVLNTTAAQVTGASTVWNSTSPTSAVFTQGGAFGGLGNMVAYCFAPVSGYSSFSSFVGNGSADGPFVYTGFRPRWLLIKNASVGTDSWQIWDAARSDYNAAQKYLLPNTSGAEGDNSAFAIDFTSNGFKVRNTNTASNGNTNTLVFAAFAESPFQYARAR